MKLQKLSENQQIEIKKRFGEQGNREFAFFMQKIMSETKLQNCTPQSLYSVAIQAADLGLTFNPAADLVYLIPYGQKAQLQLSYKGLLHLIKKANPNIFLLVELVYQGDDFKRIISTKNTDVTEIQHIQGSNFGDITKIIGGYAIWRENSNIPFNSIYLNLQQLEAIRKQSKAPNSGAWVNFLDEMYRKAILRRAMKQIEKIPVLPESEVDMVNIQDTISKFDDFEEIETENETKEKSETQKSGKDE